jgi:hypothetical protein
LRFAGDVILPDVDGEPLEVPFVADADTFVLLRLPSELLVALDASSSSDDASEYALLPLLAPSSLVSSLYANRWKDWRVLLLLPGE